jgi:hypothetical protein
MHPSLEKLFFGAPKLALIIVAALTVLTGYFAFKIQPTSDPALGILGEHPFQQNQEKWAGFGPSANPLRIAVVKRDGVVLEPAFLKKLSAAGDIVGQIPGVKAGSVRHVADQDAVVLLRTASGLSAAPFLEFASGLEEPVDIDWLSTLAHRADLVGALVSSDLSAALIEADLDLAFFSAASHDARAGWRAMVKARLKAGFGQSIVDTVVDTPTLATDKAHHWFGESVQRFFVAFLTLTLLAGLALNSFKHAVVTIATPVVGMLWALGLLYFFEIAVTPVALWIQFATGAFAAICIAAALTRVEPGVGSATDFFNAFKRSGTLSALLMAPVVFGVLFATDLAPLQDAAIGAFIGFGTQGAAIFLLGPLLLGAIEKWFAPQLRDGQLLRSSSASSDMSRLLGPFLLVLYVGVLTVGGMMTATRSLTPASEAFVASMFPNAVYTYGIVIDTEQGACIDPKNIALADEIAWRLGNLFGVTTVQSLPSTLRGLWADAQGGDLRSQTLPHSRVALTRAMGPVAQASDHLGEDCAAIPISFSLDSARAGILQAIEKQAATFEPAVHALGLSLSSGLGEQGAIGANHFLAVDAIWRSLLSLLLSLTLIVWVRLGDWRPALTFAITTSSVVAVWMLFGQPLWREIDIEAAVGGYIGIFVIAAIIVWRVERLHNARKLQDSVFEGLRFLLLGLALGLGFAAAGLAPYEPLRLGSLIVCFGVLLSMAAAMLLAPAVNVVINRFSVGRF